MQWPLMLALCLVMACGACVGPSDPPPLPSTYDRSFDASLSAALDAGIAVRVSDRAAGDILGDKNGAGVKIHLLGMPDGTVKVEFSSPNSQESNPTLGERWLAAYTRRMGR